MTIMSRRGQADNINVYEHICDTTEDLTTIDPKYITLGSIAIVLKGTAGLEVYMATSNGEWIEL